MARRVPLAKNNGGSSPAVAAKSETGPGAGVTGGAPAKVRASANTTVTVTPTKSPGILHPPPDVRCIVDKTAEFVAQNGLEFEQKILSNEKRNPTFNFLKSKDAYHSYYQQRILEFIDQGQSPVKPVITSDNNESRRVVIKRQKRQIVAERGGGASCVDPVVGCQQFEMPAREAPVGSSSLVESLSFDNY